MYARICARPYPYACNAYSHTRGRERAQDCAHGYGRALAEICTCAQACAYFHAGAGTGAPALGVLFFCVPAYQAYQNARKRSVHRHLAWYKTWYKLGTLFFCTVTAYQPKTPKSQCLSAFRAKNGLVQKRTTIWYKSVPSPCYKKKYFKKITKNIGKYFAV